MGYIDVDFLHSCAQPTIATLCNCEVQTMSEPKITLQDIVNSMEQKGSFEAVGICSRCIVKVAEFVIDQYPTAVINIYGVGGTFGLSCYAKETLEDKNVVKD